MESEHLPEHCRSLFLGDLSCFCSEQDILGMFQKYGDIETVRVMRGRHRKALGYGFLTFAEIRSAVAAKQEDGKMLLGRPIKVGWANVRMPHVKSQPKNPLLYFQKMQKMQSFDGVLDSAQIHFSFISKQNSQVVTEASIREVFSQFGEVIDVCLKKSVIDQSMGEQNGYGFIHYPLTPEGINAALKASQTLCQVYVKNVLYDCCLTWNLEALIMQQQSQQQQSSSQSSLSSRIPPPITTSFSSSFSSNTTTSSNSLLSAASTPTSIPPSPMSHHPSPMNHHQMIPPSPSHYPTNYIHRSQPAVSHSRGSPYGSIGLPRTDYSHSHAAYAMPPHPPVQNLPVTSSLSVKGEMQTQHFPFHSSSSSSNSPSNSMDYSRDLPSSNYTAFPAEDNNLFYRK